MLVLQGKLRRCAKEPCRSTESTDNQHPNVVGCFFWLAGVLAGHFWPKMESLTSGFEWPASLEFAFMLTFYLLNMDIFYGLLYDMAMIEDYTLKSSNGVSCSSEWFSPL